MAAGSTLSVPRRGREALASGQPAKPGQFKARVTQVLLFLMVLTFDLILRHRDLDDKTVDFQVIGRLAIWVAAFGWAMLQPRALIPFLRIRQSWPWLALLVWFAITAVWSPTPLLTLVSAFSLIVTLVFIFHSLAVLGEERTVGTIVAALTTLLVLCIAVYFIVPSFGRGSGWDGNSRIVGTRMAGVTNQANVAGEAAALSLLLCIAYFRRLVSRSGWLLYFALAIGVVSLILTQSRTSGISMLFALGALFILRRNATWTLPVIIALGAFFFLVAIPNAPYIAAALSRSGNAEEIYTATNRVYIWKLATWLIAQKPLFGWGYDTASQVMSLHIMDVTPELKGYIPPHAHDAYLQMMYSGGAVALALFILGLAMNAITLITQRAWAGFSILAFWAVSTFTEAVGFSGVAGVATVGTLLPVGLVCLFAINAKARGPQRAPKRVRSAAPPSGTTRRRTTPGARAGRGDAGQS